MRRCGDLAAAAEATSSAGIFGTFRWRRSRVPWTAALLGLQLRGCSPSGASPPSGRGPAGPSPASADGREGPAQDAGRRPPTPSMRLGALLEVWALTAQRAREARAAPGRLRGWGRQMVAQRLGPSSAEKMAPAWRILDPRAELRQRQLQVPGRSGWRSRGFRARSRTSFQRRGS